jgi:hypothetical protein
MSMRQNAGRLTLLVLQLLFALIFSMPASAAEYRNYIIPAGQRPEQWKTPASISSYGFRQQNAVDFIDILWRGRVVQCSGPATIWCSAGYTEGFSRSYTIGVNLGGSYDIAKAVGSINFGVNLSRTDTMSWSVSNTQPYHGGQWAQGHIWIHATRYTGWPTGAWRFTGFCRPAGNGGGGGQYCKYVWDPGAVWWNKPLDFVIRRGPDVQAFWVWPNF